MESNDITLRSSLPAYYAMEGVLNPRNRELLFKFRQQIHAVGALWIMAGGATILFGSYALFAAEPPEFLRGLPGDLLIALGFVWLILGVLTCGKEMWALTTALVLSYAVVVLGTASGSGGPGAFLILAIIQGHRVRELARTLTAEGIELTTEP